METFIILALAALALFGICVIVSWLGAWPLVFIFLTVFVFAVFFEWLSGEEVQ